MKRARRTARVLRYAALAGFHDYTTIYTWRTWLAGWWLRVLAQVTFFASIGHLLGSAAKERYLLVGNAMMLAAVAALFAVALVQWERWAGTLPLLVASPTSHVVVFAGRSAVFIADGTVTATGSLLVGAAMFGVPLPFPRSLLLLVLVPALAAATYGLAVFLAGLALHAPAARNVVLNLGQTTMMAICGVNVPLAFFPAPVEWFAHALPLTFGLRAVRELLDGAPASAVAANAVAQLAIGCGWLVLALLTFDRFAARGRRTGTIELG